MVERSSKFFKPSSFLHQQTVQNTAANTGGVRNLLSNRRKSTNAMNNDVAQPAVREQARKKSGGIFKKQDTPPPYWSRFNFDLGRGTVISD